MLFSRFVLLVLSTESFYFLFSAPSPLCSLPHHVRRDRRKRAQNLRKNPCLLGVGLLASSTPRRSNGTDVGSAGSDRKWVSKARIKSKQSEEGERAGGKDKVE